MNAAPSAPSSVRSARQFHIRNRTVSTLSQVLACVVAGFVLSESRAMDSAGARRLFTDPPREYSTAPLWVWNDLLTERQIRETLRDLASQRVMQVFVHPRPGLMTPYLSEDWFRLWQVALDEAGRLDMNVWIYDENSYPSGFAGGWVPELMPESRGRGLALRQTDEAPQWAENLIAVYRVDDGTPPTVVNVTAQVKAGESLPKGRYVEAAVQRAKDSPWHGNRCYVDLLYPGVTEKFLEVTLGAYRQQIGSQFGKRVPGSFTDEPNIHPAGGLPWTDDLPAQFQRRWGYELKEHLPSLTVEAGDWQRVRHNYYATLNDLYIERWARPYYEWCDRNGLEFTGHYWDHEWPRCVGVPDNMAMAAWQHRPGIDCLMNQYAEDTHAQFGNVRFCREIASIASQFGRKRTFVELYGAGGWDLRFEDMKRIGDWLEVLGVNDLDQHLSYVTLRGARKRDHPQSFSYHEPWWEAYHVSAAYFARLSAALSQGEQRNRVLVLEPTSTAWLYQGKEPKLKELGDAFSSLLMRLEGAQVEYDLGCEDVLARQGSITARAGDQPTRAALRVGMRDYDVVVLPPYTENLNRRTRKLLREFGGAGGRILVCGDLPSRTDGRLDEAAAPGQGEGAGWQKVEPSALPETVKKLTPTVPVSITRAPGDQGILFHHRRRLDDGELLFLVNTSIEHPSAGTITSALPGVERWDPYTGKAEGYPSTGTPGGVAISFALPPSGSLLLLLSRTSPASKPPAWSEPVTLAPQGPIEVQRVEPNVLTLDYVDVTAGGVTRSNVYFYQANQFAWQKNGLERNPWDSAVQFKDELIRKTFAPDSGFEAQYHFVIESAVPENLTFVLERPDLYSIVCNGQPVRAQEGEWWLDKAFGRIAVAKASHVGTNTLTIKASPFTMYHELEPAYLLGSFTLGPAEHGFLIQPDQPLRLATDAAKPGEGAADAGPLGWNKQGHPFYSAGVSYRQKYQVDKRPGRYVVQLPRWYGSVARVRVNGDLAGYVDAPPWECDVTVETVNGANTVEVTVIGTLKNTLGPHHGNPGLGSAWPGMFQRGPAPGPPPGAQYHTVGYGLFEPFVLKQSSQH